MFQKIYSETWFHLLLVKEDAEHTINLDMFNMSIICRLTFLKPQLSSTYL